MQSAAFASGTLVPGKSGSASERSSWLRQGGTCLTIRPCGPLIPGVCVCV